MIYNLTICMQKGIKIEYNRKDKKKNAENLSTK